MAIDDRNFSMADFPADAAAHRAWQIMRTPTKSPLQMVVISHIHAGFETHHHCGRTVPHLKADCFPCSRHMAWRWTGYLLAKQVKDGKKILFEFPEMAGLDLKQIMEEYPDLRGLALQSIRPSERKNGRVLLTTKGMFRGAIELPPDEPIKPIVYHIWGIRESAPVAVDESVQKTLTPAEAIRKKAKLKPPCTLPSMESGMGGPLPGQQRLPLESPALAKDLVGDLISGVHTNGSAGKPKG